jgi:hypothetical protein
MYIKDDVAYAGDPEELIKVVGIRPMNDHLLWLRFSTGEERVFDMGSMLEFSAFAPLKDHELFRSVYLDYGVPTWLNGKIDLAPETLYLNSADYQQTA